MATLTVSLPNDTVKYLEEKARQGGHASVDAYLGAVLYEIRLREAKQEFEAKIQEALDSGPMVPLTREDLDAIEREAMAILKAERSIV